MKFLSICTAALSMAVASASILPRQTDPKFKATSYELTGTTLHGEIDTPEGSDKVQIFWAKGDSWQETPIVAQRGWFNKFEHISFWSFSGEAPGATQFYVKASYVNKDIYAPGNFVNYQLAH
ncbi:hypothetical protein Dda_0697 [Drechslerella dactyloides]|uniref:Uncharacterized protein n=1 Tax=Drechslerella dactyloides TaxID=74499 RepID=A0AAD6NNM0_DREDA|nr:hypothetical protein Dda_0697 [Drechslerella dactyloides]